MQSRSSSRGRASAAWLAGLASAMVSGLAVGQPCDGQWQTGNGVPGISGNGSGVLMSWDPDGAGTQPELLYVGGTYKLAHTTLVKSLASWEPLFSAQNPAGIWRDVAGGLSGAGGALGSAFTMLPIGTDMLIGGQFTTAGAVAATNVVKLDGLTNTWVPYGAGVPGPVYGAVVFNGQIFICGSFHFTASNKTGDSVARWDGVRWQVVGPAANGGLQNPDPMNPLPATVPGNVFALAVYNNALYAGGDFQFAGLDLATPPMPVPCPNFARYNAQTSRWVPVIAALQEHVAKQRADVAAMEKEKALWSDPAYVEQQARQRLKFVKVGEKAYSLIDADAVPTSKAADPVLDAATASTHPWYGQLWESVKTSDNPQRSAG